MKGKGDKGKKEERGRERKKEEKKICLISSTS